MKIIFTKLSPTHHRFDIVRDDGSTDGGIFETKSLMPHDLVHVAYEKTAGLKESFYGTLAKGTSLATLMETGKEMNIQTNTPHELRITEILTGPLTAYFTGIASAQDTLAGIQNMFDAYQVTVPAHLTEAFLVKAKECFTPLYRHWQHLAHHTPMEIEY